MQIRSSSCSLVFRVEKPCVRHMAITNKQIMGFLKSGIKWWNSNKMEGRKGEKMCWAAGIWGLEAAEVMSLGRSKKRVKNKSLSLF